EAIKEQFPNIT
ncbi:unnamed protein product, partial [Rotaria socialis]